ARHNVDAQHLAGPERQQVVAHVADHDCVEEVGGMRPLRKQVTPAHGAQPERAENEGDAHREPSPLRVAQPRGDGAEVYIPEEPDEEGSADRDPEEDFDQLPGGGHSGRRQGPICDPYVVTYWGEL